MSSVTGVYKGGHRPYGYQGNMLISFIYTFRRTYEFFKLAIGEHGLGGTCLERGGWSVPRRLERHEQWHRRGPV